MESALYATSMSSSTQATEEHSLSKKISARKLDNGNHPFHDERRQVFRNHEGHIHGSREAQPMARKSQRMKAGVSIRA
jgi:hypothetical protein